jgi:hypothetical protein
VFSKRERERRCQGLLDLMVEDEGGDRDAGLLFESSITVKERYP